MVLLPRMVLDQAASAQRCELQSVPGLPPRFAGLSIWWQPAAIMKQQFRHVLVQGQDVLLTYLMYLTYLTYF